MEFRNIYELYNRLKPALKTRTNELKDQGITVEEKEIWDNLATSKWKNSKGLSLNEMVHDILNYNIKSGD